MSFSQAPTPLDRSIGDRQRYRLTKRLGEGGMGEVFLAIDTILGQFVAVKLLKEKLSSGELRKRFEREVALSVALKSDHIVQVTDYGVTSEGHPFYVMEYLQGQTLRQMLRQEKTVSIERTVNLMTQICAGLHLAHQGVNLWQELDGVSATETVKVVHRDLKPDNIFLVPTELGELVKVLDFGIAQIRSDQAEYTNANHATTVFLGTYRYAAPEQFEIGKNLDERADIYSLGMLLYEMLSGADPFGFDSTPHQPSGATWAVAHVSKLPLPLRERPGCEQLPPELEAIVMQCLQKLPESRFSSVTELTLALRAASAALHDSQNSYTARALTFIQSSRKESIGRVASSPSVPKNPQLPLQKPAKATTPDHAASGPIAPTAVKAAAAYDSVAVPHTATHALAAIPDTVTALATAVTIAHPPRASYSEEPVSPGVALLLAGLGATASLALGFGVYYATGASNLQISQPMASTIQAPAVSAQAAAQPEKPADESPVSTATNTFYGHADTVWSVAISPNGKTLVSSSADKTIRLWNLKTGQLLRTLFGHSDTVRAVAISADGQILASGSGDKTIKIWDFQTGKLLRTLSGHTGPIWSITISPDGHTLASGSYDGTIKIWSLDTGELLHTLPDHYDSVWSVAISPDGQTLVSGSYDYTVKVWDLKTGQLRRTLSGHADAVRAVAISSDGRTIASGSWDRTIKIWDLRTGQLRRTLSGHSDRVLSIAISPDGQTIASSSYDRTVRLWNLQTGEPLRTLSGHSDWVVSVAFSPTGQTLGSGSRDKTIKVWPW